MRTKMSVPLWIVQAGMLTALLLTFSWKGPTLGSSTSKACPETTTTIKAELDLRGGYAHEAEIVTDFMERRVSQMDAATVRREYAAKQQRIATGMKPLGWVSRRVEPLKKRT